MKQTNEARLSATCAGCDVEIRRNPMTGLTFVRLTRDSVTHSVETADNNDSAVANHIWNLLKSFK